MGFLRPSDALHRTIHSSRMLRPGGKVGSGSYQRRIKNVIQSGRLIHRITKEVPAAMIGNCKMNDHCVPKARPEMLGRTAPDGNPYVDCTDEERIRRIEENWKCAKENLGAVGPTPTAPRRRRAVRRRTREDILRELGL